MNLTTIKKNLCLYISEGRPFFFVIYAGNPNPIQSGYINDTVDPMLIIEAPERPYIFRLKIRKGSNGMHNVTCYTQSWRIINKSRRKNSFNIEPIYYN